MSDVWYAVAPFYEAADLGRIVQAKLFWIWDPKTWAAWSCSGVVQVIRSKSPGRIVGLEGLLEKPNPYNLAADFHPTRLRILYAKAGSTPSEGGRRGQPRPASTLFEVAGANPNDPKGKTFDNMLPPYLAPGQFESELGAGLLQLRVYLEVL